MGMVREGPLPSPVPARSLLNQPHRRNSLLSAPVCQACCWVFYKHGQDSSRSLFSSVLFMLKMANSHVKEIHLIIM